VTCCKVPVFAVIDRNLARYAEAAGIIAGIVADRERLQRLRVETTKLELERVYTELSENVQHLRKTERLTAAGQLAASLATRYATRLPVSAGLLASSPTARHQLKVSVTSSRSRFTLV